MTPRSKTELSNPRELVQNIFASDEYLQQRTTDRHKAFSNAAFSMSNNPELSRRNAHELKIMGLLPDYLDAKTRLSDNDYRYASIEDRKADLDQVLPVNHALRELIDDNPRLTMPGVKNFVAGVMISTEGPLRAEQAKEFIGKTLNGMRHELAAEDAFWKIPEVENVRQATKEEDAHGTDLVVIYKHHEIPFDIKASQIGADEANDKHGVGGYSAMYSGFTSEDFGNGFRADPESTKRLVSYYQDMLEWSIDQRAGYLRKA